jgi:hypothetical protein
VFASGNQFLPYATRTRQTGWSAWRFIGWLQTKTDSIKLHDTISSSTSPVTCINWSHKYSVLSTLRAYFLSFPTLIYKKRSDNTADFSTVWPQPTSTSVTTRRRGLSWKVGSLSDGQEIPNSYGTRGSITVLMKSCNWALSRASWIPFKASHPISPRSITVLITDLRVCLWSGLFPWGLPIM